MNDDLTKNHPKTVRAQFELAAARITESWVSAGRISVSAGDLALAQEFLEQVGWQVQQVPGLLVRLTNRDGRSQEMTREDAVVQALRELARAR